MKKKMLALLAILALTFSVGACATANDGSQSAGNSQTVESSQVSVENNQTSEETESVNPETSEEQESFEEPIAPIYAFTDFTAEEKALFEQYIGVVIPFAPNNEYYVEGYYDETGYEYGMCFYTFGNTQEEFDAYKEAYATAGYKFIESYEDENYGDTWYWYEKEDIVVDFSYYISDGDTVIDVYVYSSLSLDWNEDWEGNLGGDQNWDENGLLTNEGKGLPSSRSGVYQIDFTQATYVQNATDLGAFTGGCPTLSTPTKNPKALVIPVEFSDATAESKGYSIAKIEKAFNGKSGETDYYSLDEYFDISSNGQLDVEFTVWDTWFRPKNASTYYAKQTDRDGFFIGDQIILHEILAALAKEIDLTEYDSDNNGFIDAVIMINTLKINSGTEFQWAFRYWNSYLNNRGDYYRFDNVAARDYIWACYQFMLERYDSNGRTYYDDDAINPYTYIHEFSHVLGTDDYYDTDYQSSPMGGHDMMDSRIADHNPYTKMHLGWLTTSRLIVAEESVTVTLEAFAKTGDTIIIANNWDSNLGIYQEYYIISYYTIEGLNDSAKKCFTSEGIVVYHVNASLFQQDYGTGLYYDVYNTNTTAGAENGYGTEDNLIELVKSSSKQYVYRVGDSLAPTVTDDQGNKISYTFTVDSIADGVATLTFTKN